METKKRVTNLKEVDGYKLLDQLGGGGFGTVYLALQKSTGQKVAIKMLRVEEEFDEQRRRRKIERFEREAQLCAGLHHSNIVKLLDKGKTADNQPFAVYEFVPGKTLKEVLFERGALPPIEAGNIMEQVLDALVCAHAQGIVHRDLKPQNIIISHTGAKPQAKVLDYGIGAFTAEARGEGYKSLTLTRETIGTPFYSAPEQLRGEPPTIKSDLYSWGLVLLEALTGSPVMKGVTLAEIIHQQLSHIEISLPSSITGHPLGNLLRRVLRKNAKDRIGSAQELYSKFHALKLDTLVGSLQQERPSFQTADYTVTQEVWTSFDKLRQITVLCCSLHMQSNDNTNLETLETLQRDQQNFLYDTCVNYGGHQAGALGNSVMFYFGYPSVSENDARRAARAALEMMEKIKHRTALLEKSHGIQLALRVGIHTGEVLIGESINPNGITPNKAMELEKITKPNSILVSETTYRLLEIFLHFEPIAFGYLLVGERQVEALQFLRPGSARRPLLGREKEFKILQDLWELAEKQKGGILLLQGEAGLGKSRLSHEIRHLVHEKGFLSRDCRCLPEQQNNALFPFLEMLQALFHLLDSQDTEKIVERLKSILEQSTVPLDLSMPILCSWLGLPLPDNFSPLLHSPNKQKEILLDILEELILEEKQGIPFLLVVEDFHWIDPTSVELIERLIQKVPTKPVFLLITTRPHYPFSPSFKNVTRAGLERLTEEETGKMVKTILENQPIEQKSLKKICERTDGVPLFIEELTSMLLKDHYLVQEGGEYVLTNKFDKASIPVTLKDLLNEKLEKLGPAGETIRIAAVIGRQFDYDLLVQISLRDEAMVQVDLQISLAADLIYRQRKVQGESYFFHHALIRDAAYEGMLHSVREQTHAGIAMCLENYFPETKNSEPAILANHFAKARRFEKSVKYNTQAAEIALQRSLNEETIAHSEETLAWIPNLPPENQAAAELEINSIQIQAMMSKFGWADPKVKKIAERSGELIEQIEEKRHKIHVLWALGLYHHVASNRKEVRAIVGELFRIAYQSNDSGEMVAAATLSGAAHYTDGKYPEALADLKKAIDLYDPDEHKDHGMQFGLDTFSWAAATLSLIYWFRGNTEEAWQWAEKALDWAKSLNHIPSLSIVQLYRSNLYHFTGKRELAQAVVQELLKLSKKYGLPAFEGYATLVHAWTTENIEIIDNVVGVLQGMGCRLGLPYYAAYPADIEYQRGNYSEALKRLEASISFCKDGDEHLYEPELYRLKANVLYDMKMIESEKVKTVFQQAIELANSQGMLRIEALALKDFSVRYGLSQEHSVRFQELRELGVMI